MFSDTLEAIFEEMDDRIRYFSQFPFNINRSGNYVRNLLIDLFNELNQRESNLTENQKDIINNYLTDIAISVDSIETSYDAATVILDDMIRNINQINNILGIAPSRYPSCILFVSSGSDTGSAEDNEDEQQDEQQNSEQQNSEQHDNNNEDSVIDEIEAINEIIETETIEQQQDEQGDENINNLLLDISYDIVPSNIVVQPNEVIYYSTFCETLNTDADINRRALENYDIFTFIRNMIVSIRGEITKAETYTFVNNYPYKDNQLCFRDSGLILIEFNVNNSLQNTAGVIIDKREPNDITFETCLLVIRKLYNANVFNSNVYNNEIYYIYNTTNNEDIQNGRYHYDFDDLTAKYKFKLTIPGISEQINVRFCVRRNLHSMILIYHNDTPSNEADEREA